MIHQLFDVLAWSGGLGLGWWVQRRWLAALPAPALRRHPLYFAAALTGAAVGAVGLGTLNMALSGQAGVGRSVIGGLLGAILAVELYKACRGVAGSTGLVFVVPLAFGIAVGRVGCLLSGLDDFTYGTATDLPWGVDFGDGVVRHPVQAYESLAMLAWLAGFLAALSRGHPVMLRHGFALFVGWYGLQRFAWECLKPYGAVVGPLTVFHIACLGLILYSGLLIWRRSRPDAH